MRAALIAMLLGAPFPAMAGAPLAFVERQVVTLEFERPVVRVAITDPDLLTVRTVGSRVTITALKAGRATLELAFADAATVSYEVSVEGARRSVVREGAPNDIDLSVGEERRFRAPGVARVLIEENGVARVAVQRDTVSVVALTAGEASLVLVDGAGAKTAWKVRVR